MPQMPFLAGKKLWSFERVSPGNAYCRRFQSQEGGRFFSPSRVPPSAVREEVEVHRGADRLRAAAGGGRSGRSAKAVPAAALAVDVSPPRTTARRGRSAPVGGER